MSLERYQKALVSVRPSYLVNLGLSDRYVAAILGANKGTLPQDEGRFLLGPDGHLDYL